MLTFRQRIFKFACEYLLGAKIFKKYWFTGGSIWNKIHIDKNSIYDMENIIDESWSYTKVHLQSLFVETLTYTFCYMYEINKDVSYLKLLYLLGGIHAYAIVIHEYNRMLATDRISYLQKHKEEIKEDKKIFYIHNSGNYYAVKHSKLYITIGPYSKNKEKVEKFYEYILNNYDEDYVLEQDYLDSCKKIYDDWSVSLLKN
jgi:hypothetical protein